MEGDATAAGATPSGVPVRLPDIEEVKRRPDSPSNAGVLGPAHALLNAHPSTALGGGVGLPTPPAAAPPESPRRGRTRMADVSDD
jgi:hypothetical protein